MASRDRADCVASADGPERRTRRTDRRSEPVSSGRPVILDESGVAAGMDGMLEAWSSIVRVQR